MLGDFDRLPFEVICVIAAKSGAACQRLWKYLPGPFRHELRKMPITPDFIRDFRVTGTVYRDNNYLEKTTLFGWLHSFDDFPAVWGSGTQEWWCNGHLHRANDPAIMLDNLTAAWNHGQLESVYHACRNAGRTVEIWFTHGEVKHIQWMHYLVGIGPTLAKDVIINGVYQRTDNGGFHIISRRFYS